MSVDLQGYLCLCITCFLLLLLFYTEMALSILEENGDLALERDEQKNTPLHIMAKKSNGTIGAKNNPTKWQSSINKC